MDLVVRHANYGLELKDALTHEALIGGSSVTAALLSPPTPGTKANLVPFLVNRSRWVFEELEVEVDLDIEADFYLPQSGATGTDFPTVPPSGPGLLVTVNMVPRLGYPFAPTLTRVLGAARTSSNAPAVPANVTVTPYYGAGHTNPGPNLTTHTDDQGQYVIWFLADPTMSPTLPVTCRVAIATAAPLPPESGSAYVDLVRNQATGASLITLS